MIRKAFPLVLALAALLAWSPAWAQTKIGFVSLDRILREAPAAQRAQKKIEQEFSKRDQELAKTSEQLKKMRGDLERNGMTMSESDRQRREREFNELNVQFQRKQREFHEDLNARRNDELAGVIAQANRAIKHIAETEKYDIIFQDAVWANPKIDITDKVIKSLDAAKAPPAAK